MRQRDREIEVKFSCNAETLALVLNTLASRAATKPEIKELHTTYFDTTDLRLRTIHAILRVRHSAGQTPLLCFKSVPTNESGSFNRLELELPAVIGQPDLSLFPGETARWLKGVIGKKVLKAQFEVKVKRRSLLMLHHGAEIEISADEGNVVSGEKTAAVTELELELKSGDEGALFELALSLAREFPLSLSFLTKSERGFRLIGALPVAPLSILEPILAPSTLLDEIAETSLSQALHNLMGHWDAARDAQSPESIHQLRIALRRLRTHLANFSRVSRCAEFDELKQEGRAIASVLGKLRSLDVLTESLNELPTNAHLSTRDRRLISKMIGQRRAVAAMDARVFMNDPVTSQFLLKTQHVIATRAWAKAWEKDTPVEAQRLDEFVRKTLDIQFKRVLRRGEGFSKLGARELHSVRLGLKALNYTAGAFSYLFEQNKDAKRFQSESLRLQRGLGALNDNDFALQFCKELAESGTISGVAALGEDIAVRFISERKTLHTRWKKFKKMQTYWQVGKRPRNKA